jgi:hypothetical protein
MAELSNRHATVGPDKRRNSKMANRNEKSYCGAAAIWVATNRRRRCSPDVVAGYFGVSPGFKQVGMQLTSAS